MATLTETFLNIANAIREKGGTSETMKPTEMATNITNLPSGGGEEKLKEYIVGTMTEFSVPNGTTTIGSESFSYLTSLETIVIPSSVTNIMESAFYYSSNITNYDFTKLKSIPTLDNTNAFNGINSEAKIKVPSSLYEDWHFADNWVSYKNYITYDGIELTVEDGTTSIADNEYKDNVARTIVLPDGLTSIGSSAFEGCLYVKSINLPTTITSIGSSAFKDCPKVECWDFSSFTSIPTLGEGAFDDEGEWMYIKVPMELWSQWIASENWSAYADKIEPSPTYLTFIAKEDNSTVAMTANGSPVSISLQYRIGLDGEWQDFTVGETTITLNTNEFVQFKGNNSAIGGASSDDNYNAFTLSGKLEVYGSPIALLNETDTISGLNDRAFGSLFRECEAITKAPIVWNFTSTGVTSLAFMFSGCTNMTIGPRVLPCTSIGGWGCGYMFSDCTSLLRSPIMPSAYYSWRNYCRLNFIFNNCTSLKEIKTNWTDVWLNQNTYGYGYEGWVTGVPSTGTFYYNGTDYTRGVYAIPEGWTVKRFD